MDKKKRNLIISIVWKPFFAAIMTAILSELTDFSAILIGVVLGLASSISCYFDLKKYFSKSINE